MRIAQTYQTKSALQTIRNSGVAEQLEVVLNQAELPLKPRASAAIKDSIESRLDHLGWLIHLRIDVDLRAEVNAFHSSGTALQVQLGNVARAFYDLMKLQRLYELNKISVGVLVVPMKAAAVRIGSNLASFERLSEEHELM